MDPAFDYRRLPTGDSGKQNSRRDSAEQRRNPQLPPMPQKDHIPSLQERIMLKNGIGLTSKPERKASRSPPKRPSMDMDSLLDEWKNGLSQGDYNNQWNIKPSNPDNQQNVGTPTPLPPKYLNHPKSPKPNRSSCINNKPGPTATNKLFGSMNGMLDSYKVALERKRK
jgi:hypothetical protein